MRYNTVKNSGLLGCWEQQWVYLFQTFLIMYHLHIQLSGRMKRMHCSKIPWMLEMKTVLSFKRSGNSKSATQHNTLEYPNAQHLRCKNLVWSMTLTHWMRSSHCIKLLSLCLRGQSSMDCLTTQMEALQSCYSPATTCPHNSALSRCLVITKILLWQPQISQTLSFIKRQHKMLW